MTSPGSCLGPGSGGAVPLNLPMLASRLANAAAAAAAYVPINHA